MDDTEIGIGLAFLMLLFGGKKKPPEIDPKIYIPAVPAPQKPDEPPKDPDPPKPDPKAIADLIRDDWPKDGRIFKVSSGYQFLGKPPGTSKPIVYRAIADKAYRVAKEHGRSNDAALAYAKQIAGVGSNRLAYFHAIQCDAWNDQLYGTFGYGPKAMPSQHGRAIRLLPQHADNVARMLQGQAPIRSILLRTPNDAGKGNGIAAGGAPKGHFEALWLPEIDGEHMWLTGQIRVFTAGPPKLIDDLGMEDASGAPKGQSWGC